MTVPQVGVSTEWIEDREDEIAEFLIARDQVDSLRRLLDLLHQRQMITNAYYQDARDSLDYIAAALLTGKRNTALLRNTALN
jgi:hypothetical protein